MRLNKILLPLFTLFVAFPAFAQEGAAIQNKGMFALGAGVAIGFAALGGGIGQGIAAGNMLSGVARNPSAFSKVFVPFILGLALIESLVIFAFAIAGGFLGPMAG